MDSGDVFYWSNFVISWNQQHKTNTFFSEKKEDTYVKYTGLMIDVVPHS